MTAVLLTSKYKRSVETRSFKAKILNADVQVRTLVPANFFLENYILPSYAKHHYIHENLTRLIKYNRTEVFLPYFFYSRTFLIFFFLIILHWMRFALLTRKIKRSDRSDSFLIQKGNRICQDGNTKLRLQFEHSNHLSSLEKVYRGQPAVIALELRGPGRSPLGSSHCFLRVWAEHSTRISIYVIDLYDHICLFNIMAMGSMER